MRNRYFIFFLLAFISCRLISQDITANALKTAYIYNFTKYITWPNEDTLDQFTIGVYGFDPGMLAELQRLKKSKEVKGLPLRVIELNDLSALDQVQILYVAQNQNKALSRVAAKASKTNTLLVTDDNDAKQLIMIDFVYPKKDRIEFEINKSNRLSSKISMI